MAEKLRVSMVTPEREVARADVDMVVAPSQMGQVGILPSHRALLADLDIGTVELRVDGKVERFAVSGGFLEVARNRVVLLCETAERAADIDVDRAKATLVDAEAKLKKLDPMGEQYPQEVERAKRARCRLGVAATLAS